MEKIFLLLLLSFYACNKIEIHDIEPTVKTHRKKVYEYYSINDIIIGRSGSTVVTYYRVAFISKDRPPIVTRHAIDCVIKDDGPENTKTVHLYSSYDEDTKKILYALADYFCVVPKNKNNDYWILFALKNTECFLYTKFHYPTNEIVLRYEYVKILKMLDCKKFFTENPNAILLNF